MIRIERFVFNTFQVNSYLLFDETLECLVIDPTCYDDAEKKELTGFIGKNGLKPVRSILTHCHIDHILGCSFIADTYGLLPEYHKASAPFFLTAREIALSFGYDLKPVPVPARYLSESDRIRFGNSVLEVFYTPGHADGSVCFYSREQGFVITGDVLFRDTIGRTDLPSGSLDLLLQSIREKLFTLPDETVIFSGHGPETTIGYEKMNNPFIR
jgi:glyoxylase-like metal-dependent hydrolase (beta-lactamase superfamily II)